MAYIIDLPLVMQNLFWLVTIYRVPVSHCLVNLAAKAYESDIKVQVHTEIKKHVELEGILSHKAALSKIVGLIDPHCMDTVEMFKLRGKIGVSDITRKND